MVETNLDNFVALKVFTKQKATFVVGEKEFTMKPLTPKKLSKMVELMESSGKSFSEVIEFKEAVDFGLTKVIELFALIFDATIDQAFADEHITVPLCYEIWEHFVKLNRLEALLPFFQQAIRLTLSKAVKKDPTI